MNRNNMSYEHKASYLPPVGKREYLTAYEIEERELQRRIDKVMRKAYDGVRKEGYDEQVAEIVRLAKQQLGQVTREDVEAEIKRRMEQEKPA